MISGEALPESSSLYLTPGAYLGFCCYKLPESLEDPVYPKLFSEIRGDEYRLVLLYRRQRFHGYRQQASRYVEKIGSDIRILGEPKTIDNDLVNTDHTPDSEVLPAT